MLTQAELGAMAARVDNGYEGNPAEVKGQMLSDISVLLEEVAYWKRGFASFMEEFNKSHAKPDAPNEPPIKCA